MHVFILQIIDDKTPAFSLKTEVELALLSLPLPKKMVAGPRIELGTRGFSVPCSTD